MGSVSNSSPRRFPEGGEFESGRKVLSFYLNRKGQPTCKKVVHSKDTRFKMPNCSFSAYGTVISGLFAGSNENGRSCWGR